MDYWKFVQINIIEIMKEKIKTFIKNHIWSLMLIFGLLIASLIVKFDTGVFAACFIYSCLAMLVEDKARKEEHETLPLNIIMIQNHIYEVNQEDEHKIKVVFDDSTVDYITYDEYTWLVEGKLNIKEILENHKNISSYIN